MSMDGRREKVSERDSHGAQPSRQGLKWRDVHIGKLNVKQSSLTGEGQAYECYKLFDESRALHLRTKSATLLFMTQGNNLYF